VLVDVISSVGQWASAALSRQKGSDRRYTSPVHARRALDNGSGPVVAEPPSRSMYLGLVPVETSRAKFWGFARRAALGVADQSGGAWRRPFQVSPGSHAPDRSVCTPKTCRLSRTRRFPRVSGSSRRRSGPAFCAVVAGEDGRRIGAPCVSPAAPLDEIGGAVLCDSLSLPEAPMLAPVAASTPGPGL
jgi:hypothetical protein